MKTRSCRIVFFVCTIALSVAKSSSYGFNENAHILLSRRTLQPGVSILDDYLRSVLNFEFPNGINEILTEGLKVSEHMEFGAVREDDGVRVRNHFHNPRLPWNQAGSGLSFSESLIVWAQDPSQLSTDQRSWHDARNYYFQALTATSDSERKRLYAETFRTLGHQIHLVQDAATPAHTRNDWHLCVKRPGFCPDPDEFHFWAETLAGQGVIGGSTPLPFDTGLLNQSSPNSNAPIPIARIIDSTDGDIGPLALVPGVSMGLAEYSSANFFSDDTIDSPNFYSPSSSQVEVRIEADLSTPPKQRPYVYFLPGFGEQDYSLALASAMVNYVTDPLATPNEKGLDAKVFQGYGEKLFPRAIGYSAGLVDYFFRNGLWGFAIYQNCYIGLPFPTQPPCDEIGIGVYNFPAEAIIDENWIASETAGPGRIVVVVHYIHQGQKHYFTLSDTFATIEAESGASWFANSAPLGQIPVGATDVYLIFAYRGPLGQESDAVVGGIGYFSNPPE